MWPTVFDDWRMLSFRFSKNDLREWFFNFCFYFTREKTRSSENQRQICLNTETNWPTVRDTVVWLVLNFRQTMLDFHLRVLIPKFFELLSFMDRQFLSLTVGKMTSFPSIVRGWLYKKWDMVSFWVLYQMVPLFQQRSCGTGQLKKKTSELWYLIFHFWIL